MKTTVGYAVGIRDYYAGAETWELTGDELRIYLAGPMSGIENHNYPTFNAVAKRLRAKGCFVENPAETPPQESWQSYMRHALSQMMRCDVVALLPGWSDSEGAFMEYSIASRLGIPCHLWCLIPEQQ